MWNKIANYDHQCDRFPGGGCGGGAQLLSSNALGPCVSNSCGGNLFHLLIYIHKDQWRMELERAEGKDICNFDLHRRCCCCCCCGT